jgi:hypothetical protein
MHFRSRPARPRSRLKLITEEDFSRSISLAVVGPLVALYGIIGRTISAPDLGAEASVRRDGRVLEHLKHATDSSQFRFRIDNPLSRSLNTRKGKDGLR